MEQWEASSVAGDVLCLRSAADDQGSVGNDSRNQNHKLEINQFDKWSLGGTTTARTDFTDDGRAERKQEKDLVDYHAVTDSTGPGKTTTPRCLRGAATQPDDGAK